MKYFFIFTIFSQLSFSSDLGQSHKIFEEMDLRFKGMRDTIEKMMGDDMNGFGFSESSSLKFDWVDTKEGKDLKIELPHKNQKLDIKVSKGVMKVSGEVKIEKVEKNKYGESRSVSEEFVSRQFPLPQGCSDKNYKVEKKEKVLFVKFKCSLSQSGGVKKVIPRKPKLEPFFDPNAESI